MSTLIGLAFDSIREERFRQERLKLEGRYTYTCADPRAMTPCEKLAVLAEECGEVAHEALRKELVEVAAVAVAWIESLDAEWRDAR